MKKIFFLFVAPCFASDLYSQDCTKINVTHEYDIPADCKGVTMTMKHDNNGKSFLYVASKEAGLKIYTVSASPALVKIIPVASFNSLDVMNLSQTGNYLYLALGNHFSRNQNSGFAVVDVTDPAKAFVSSFWFDPKLKGGAGVVECRDDYVYLGAMGNGLFIFDVADKKKIVFVSKIIPDLKFPDVKYDAKKINARGIVVKGNLLYLSYDAGGLRIIDVTNKKAPTEIGRYSNPVMNGKPRAYNNAVLNDSLIYVTVDYCGLEILNISNPSKITLVNWWNPWNCETSAMKWFKSDGHLNEIDFEKKSKLLFISSGKSDLHIISVANPSSPVLCKVYGGIDNDIGTWGVSVYENKIYLSYICTLGIPFKSNWAGVKILSYKP